MRIERVRGERISPVIAVLAAVAFGAFLPDRYRLLPGWFALLAVIIVLAPMIIAALIHSDTLDKLERVTFTTVIVLAAGINTANLLATVGQILFNSKNVNPAKLIESGLMIWVSNILVFALLYWELDCGGPDDRAKGRRTLVDFDFPAYEQREKVRPNWTPGFSDYLFLAFTTSTAFSPTEAMPLSARAKLMMMMQSVISLITISVVASRAIGII